MSCREVLAVVERSERSFAGFSVAKSEVTGTGTAAAALSLPSPGLNL